MRTRPVVVMMLLLLLSACGEDNTDAYFENCKYGKPKAIFSSDTPGVESHSFRLKSKEGIEKIIFESGKELTIIQTGCDSIRQNFQFRLPGSYEKDGSLKWVEITVEQFEYLAGLGPEYMVFSSWAQSIAARAQTIRLAESTEIQPGFFVRIDRIISRNHADLLVTLSESP